MVYTYNITIYFHIYYFFNLVNKKVQRMGYRSRFKSCFGEMNEYLKLEISHIDGIIFFFMILLLISQKNRDDDLLTKSPFTTCSFKYHW